MSPLVLAQGKAATDVVPWAQVTQGLFDSGGTGTPSTSLLNVIG
jgi:hypothetical protein